MKYRQEGFWYSKSEPHFPVPEPCKGKKWKKNKAAFLKKLISIQGRAHEVRYKGWSTCRICKAKVGSFTYQHGEWEWPEGFEHYIREHDVMPTKEFRDFIRKGG